MIASADKIVTKALGEILRDLCDTGTSAGINITGLAIDSRQIRAGYLFLAMPGSSADGRKYIDDAIKRGAAAVLYEHHKAQIGKNYPVPVIALNNLRDVAGKIADRFYDSPSQSLTVIGITGTNGKTTCTQLLTQTLSQSSKKCAVIGTLGCGFLGGLDETFHTTPDVVTVHKLLSEYRDAGAEYVCMEVSSHALAQGRVNEVEFDIAVFTNLSRDHLDYHGTMDVYGAAKATLFGYDSLRYAVINHDDSFGRDLIATLGQKKSSLVKVISYGIDSGDVRAQQVMPRHDGLDMTVTTPMGEATVRSHLFGRFNANNLLAVLAVLLVSDYSLQQAVERLSNVQPVAGRVEGFGGDAFPWVVVDYAHTPDALEQVLKALREHTQGQLWCVFGCGGNRDRGKRPQMGRLAEQLSDVVILTDDNPRHESSDDIINDIVGGMTSRPEVIRPRERAIRFAVQQAAADDIVLVAGKGHETYQQIGDDRLPYSDRETVQAILGEAA